MRARWTATTLLALLPAALPAAPVPEAGPVLSRVPAQAPIVLQLRGVEGVRGRIGAFVANAAPEFAPAFEAMSKAQLENGWDGRKLRGLAKDGPHFLVFLELPRDRAAPPKMAVLAAVTDYRAFRDGLLKDDERTSLKVEQGYESVVPEGGETVYFVDKKDYAVVTPQKDVAVAFTKKQPGLDTRISKEQAARLLASDLGVYLSLDTLNKEYADQIKQGREFLEQVLKAAAEGAGGEPTEQEKLVMGLGLKTARFAFQALEDSRGVIAGLEFRPQALALHLESELRPGTPTSQTLADSRPAAFRDLGRLPGGMMVYTAYQLGPSLTRALGGLTLGLLDAGDKGGARQKALNDLMAAGPGARLDAASLPAPGVRVWAFAEPARAVAAQLAVLKSMGAGDYLDGGIVKAKPIVRADAEKLGAITLHFVEVEWDLEKTTGSSNLPEEVRKQLAEGLKNILGEKRRFWFGTDGKVVLQVYADDWETARKQLEDYRTGKGTVGAAADFGQVRKELPAEASLVTLIDPLRYAAAMVGYIRPLIAGTVPLPPNFPPRPGKPTYVGAAVTVGADRGSFDLVISAASVREGFQAVMGALRGGE